MRRSILDSIDDDSFRQIILQNNSLIDAIEACGLHRSGGGSRGTIQKRCIKQNLEVELSALIERGKTFARTQIKKFKSAPMPEQSIFCQNSKVCRSTLRSYFLKKTAVPYICQQCSSPPVWNNKELVLQVDHINGISDDNRLDNLRWICPNCHSQTNTFTGRNKKQNKKLCICNCGQIKSFGAKQCWSCHLKQRTLIPKHSKPNNASKHKYKKENLCSCGMLKLEKSKYCNNCTRHLPKPTKIQWPSDQELAKLVWEKPRSQLAKELGVSDKAIGKRCTKLGISQPSRGYWMKV